MNTHCCAHLASARQLEQGYIAHRAVLLTGHMQVVFECWSKVQCCECGKIELVKYNLPAVFEPLPVAPLSAGQAWRALVAALVQKLRRQQP